jgi:crotonobetainyl-CoA:carnitine CoA-transferase CaiB-like acyl-CoA transferase
MGAEVIKVEEQRNPDPVRQYPPFREGISWLFLSLNAGKKHVEYDAQNPIHREALQNLVASADALVEQFRPGTMDKMQLGYERLSALNPRLIYVSVSGYPEGSEAFLEAGHDINYMAECGALAFIKDASGQPVLPAFQAADIVGGSFGLVMAVMAGLLERERTGRGRHIRVAMTSLARQLCFLPALWQQLNGGLEGYLLAGNMPNYGIYATADGYVALGALEPKFWMAFCEAMEKPNWATRLFTDSDGGQILRKEVADFLRAQTTAQVLERCRGKDCCLSPVREKAIDVSAPSVADGEYHTWPVNNGQVLRIPTFALGDKRIGNFIVPGQDNLLFGFQSE